MIVIDSDQFEFKGSSFTPNTDIVIRIRDDKRLLHVDHESSIMNLEINTGVRDIVRNIHCFMTKLIQTINTESGFPSAIADNIHIYNVSDVITTKSPAIPFVRVDSKSSVEIRCDAALVTKEIRMLFLFLRDKSVQAVASVLCDRDFVFNTSSLDDCVISSAIFESTITTVTMCSRFQADDCLFSGESPVVMNIEYHMQSLPRLILDSSGSGGIAPKTINLIHTGEMERQLIERNIDLSKTVVAVCCAGKRLHVSRIKRTSCQTTAISTVDLQ